MTINQKKSLAAFYLSKYNMDAVNALGYTGISRAMKDISERLGVPNNYIGQRRDEFDVFFDNGRKGRRNREPSKAVNDYYKMWNNIEFDVFTSMVKQVIEGEFDSDQILRNDFNTVSELPENEIEYFVNFNDDTAGIKESNRVVLERVYSTSKILTLKRLYEYRCQICGKSFKESYGTDIAEAHHIKYFSESKDNSSSNILIVCPDHHRLIHALKPTFDYDKFTFTYPGGVVEKLRLNYHLEHDHDIKN